MSEKQRAILVGLHTHRGGADSDDSSLRELEGLLETAGGECVGIVLQNRDAPDARTFIGEGKAEEVAQLVQTSNAEIVVFDNSLSPSQTRVLEQMLDVPVIDRSFLILDIFAQRAQTREGRVQVELAQYQYLLPRLTGLGNVLSRLGGGIGTRGPGETKLESDRRHIRRRIDHLKAEQEQIRHVREVSRRGRDKNEVPQVSLIGYTNAGKSTLLNSLTGESIQTGDRLFDTLDPTTRRMRLTEQTDALVTDTVGFIRKLPHHLVDAFRATLEELRYTDLLLHVIDASHPEWAQQAEVAESLVTELGAGSTPLLRVFNKSDLSNPDGIPFAGGDTVRISAKTGDGLDRLCELMAEKLGLSLKQTCLLLPYEQSALLDRLYKEGRVLKTDYQAGGIRVEAECPPPLYGVVQGYQVP